MMIDKKTRFLVVGLGLMGGSYARGLTQKGYHVDAIVNDEKSKDFALKHEIVQKCSDFVDFDLIENADVLIFALYPHTFIDWIKENGSHIKEGAIITDVTGVKGCIVEKVQSLLPKGVEFISAHPMAGREVYGVENSDERMFFGANYIVVPTEKNTENGIECCKRIAEILGFGRIVELSPKEHDDLIGFVSQLTHCIAVSLMTCYENEHLEKYTADSFRDLTRIANINETLWSELFFLNRESLLRQMELFEAHFHKLYESLKTGDRDTMVEMMKESTERRKLFNK